MGNKLKALTVITVGTLTGMQIYNKVVDKLATQNHKLPDTMGEYYEWTHGKVYYSKKGSGSPLLLVHDVDPTASGFEWSKISNSLALHHTVYNIDLLGCGRSDKPGLEYNNYLYVQLIQSFVKDVIGLKTDVIASNLASSFILTANNLEPDLFDHIVCINPTSINELALTPNPFAKAKKALFDAPIVGTAFYNILSNRLHIEALFNEFYFSRSSLATNDLKETYFEAAHLNSSNGKYLLSSIYGNYMNVNMRHAVKKIDKPICIIGSRDIQNNRANMEAYELLNNNVDVTMLSGAKNYPQLEIPEKTLKVIENFLEEAI